MARYIIKKILISLVTIFVLATMTFFLVKLMPGDPFLNEDVPKQIQDAQREYYGLDKPVWQQYLVYMNNLLHGDLGTSLKKIGKSVLSIIQETFPVSAKLGIISLVFAECIGLLFGVLCAQFKNRFPDYLLMILAIIGIAVPSMVLGPLMRYFIGTKLCLLPPAGWGTWQQIIMPAFVLGASTIATTTRRMRASMLSVMTQDYVKTAKAKGLHPVRVVWKHELKNALVPMVANMGVLIAGVLMGSFVVESIFLIPGLGRYYVDSVTNLDYPLIMGTTIFYGAFLVIMNLLVDILYGVIDPRIRVK